MTILELLLSLSRVFLAAVFLVAACAKLLDLRGTRGALGEFGMPVRLAGPLAVVLPAVELGVAALLVPTATAVAGAAAALGLLAVFSAAIALALARGRSPDCNCFGRLGSGPTGRSSLVRNALLGSVTGFALAAGLAAPGTATFGGMSATEGLLAAVVLVAAGGLAAFVALLRAYGRVLVRVERLEAQLAVEGQPAPALVEVGSPAPSLEHLQPLGGDVPTLAGADTLVLFWNPGCGFCRSMHEDLLEWEDTAADLRLVVVSSGDEESTRAERFASTVLLDPEGGAMDSFGAVGTPSAIVVDAEGLIASELLVGAEAVLGRLRPQLVHVGGSA